MGVQLLHRRHPVARPATPETEWTALRRLIGADRLAMPIFQTRRSSLADLKPGEKFLILLRYAGIGDHLNASMIFPALREQYPEIHVSYAIQSRFHPLFDGTGVNVISHDGPVDPEWLRAYDLIEDINTPCHAWERFFVARGGTDGDGHGLRWRNRLDLMSQWFGLRITAPHSPIVIRPAEREQARHLLAQMGTDGKPICLFAPFSFEAARCYPWFAELSAALTGDGWDVRYLHDRAIPGPMPTLSGLSLRMMGAACAVADLIVSTDTAAYHWGGLLGRPTVAFFNSQCGINHCRDYPTVRPVQACPAPCITNVRWGGDNTSCPHLTRETLPQVPGLGLSRCFGRETVDQIMASVRTVAGTPGDLRKEMARQ